MASREVQSDYALVSKILSSMILDKPVALVTVSQKTGIKLAEIIRFARQLENEKIIARTMDNGNIFYVLKVEDYESTLKNLYGAPEPDPAPTPVNSREAIMQRRSRRAAMEKGELQNPPAPSNNLVDSHSGPMASGYKRSQPGIERISAVDLLALKRSSQTNPRIFPNRATTKFIPKSVDLPIDEESVPEQSEQNETTQANPLKSRQASGSFRSVVAGTPGLQKAVFINKPVPRSGGRSMFSGIPKGMDYMQIERSDGNIAQNVPDTPTYRENLIPYRAQTQNLPDITENDIREKLNIAPDAPLLTVLSPRPSHAIWTSCSALANAGGGILILGAKKYERDDAVTYYIKSINNPDDAIKQLMRAFNDRSVISDCPKDPSFIEVADFGRKRVLVLHIDPEQLAPAPLFTQRDSFNPRETGGCYIYRNGEVIHCTEEEVKALWVQRRLGQELPDWDQTAEQVPIKLERKKKLQLPPIIDDAVRPMSRKECTFGQPLPDQPGRYLNSKHHPKPTNSKPRKTTVRTPWQTALEEFATNAPAPRKPVPDMKSGSTQAENTAHSQNMPFEESAQLSNAQLSQKYADISMRQYELYNAELAELKESDNAGESVHQDEKRTQSLHNLLSAEDIQLPGTPTPRRTPSRRKTATQELRNLEESSAAQKRTAAAQDRNTLKSTEELSILELLSREAEKDRSRSETPTRSKTVNEYTATPEEEPAKPRRGRKKAVVTVIDEGILSGIDTSTAKSTTRTGSISQTAAAESTTADTQEQPVKRKRTSKKALLEAIQAEQDALTPNLPPLFRNANRKELEDIAAPALAYSRLPVTRLCEITLALCQKARLTQTELCALIQRKPAILREKLMPILEQHPEFHYDNGFYYVE